MARHDRSRIFEIRSIRRKTQMAVCQNLVPLVNIKIAGTWMFIPLKMVLIGIDPYPNCPPVYHQQQSRPGGDKIYNKNHNATTCGSPTLEGGTGTGKPVFAACTGFSGIVAATNISRSESESNKHCDVSN